MKIRLKEILKNKKKSIVWLSERTGIKYAVLARMSANRVRKVKLENVDKVCKVLEVSIDDLLKESFKEKL